MLSKVLIIVKLLEFAVFDSAEKNRDLIRVELANHLGLLSSI